MSGAISRLSAAMAVRAWTEQYGRFPLARECLPTNGLPHFTTIYHMFEGLGELRNVAERLSAGDFQAWEALGKTLKTKRCLKCDTWFEAERDIWRCKTCRSQARNYDDELPTLSTKQLRHFFLNEVNF